MKKPNLLFLCTGNSCRSQMAEGWVRHLWPGHYLACFPGRTIHQGFADPPQLAVGAASEEEALAHYRRVRDELRAWVEKLPRLLGKNPNI